MNPYQDNTLLYGTKYAITRDNQLVILSADKTDQKRYRYESSIVLQYRYRYWWAAWLCCLLQDYCEILLVLL